MPLPAGNCLLCLGPRGLGTKSPRLSVAFWPFYYWQISLNICTNKVQYQQDPALLRNRFGLSTQRQSVHLKNNKQIN